MSVRYTVFAAVNDSGSARSLPSLLVATSGWLLIVGLLVRIRIAHDTPLPSSEPVAWFVTGTLQDIAVVAFAIAAALAAGRIVPRIARASFVALAAILGLLHIVRSEAVVFFGNVIRPEDLHGDVPLTLALGSLRGTPMVLFVASVVLACAVPWVARRLGPLPWCTLVPALAVGTISGAISIAFSIFVPRAGLARNPVVALFAIEHEAMESPHERFDVQKPSVSPTAIREFLGLPNDRKYVDFEYPLAYVPSGGNELVGLPAGVKPNIVFLVMESVRAEEVGCYGADPPNVTPNIDALARDGIRFDPAYSAGTYTASGEIATWYGLTPIPREVLMTSRPDLEATGIPELLRLAGWRSFFWIHGGDSNFYRRDSFYIPRGFRVIDGRSFASTEPSTNWGYSDRSLANNAVIVLNRAREPFAAMVLTLSNHHPFLLPADADPPMPLPPASHSSTRTRRTPDMVQTIHYTDEAIGDFFRQARKRPWFARTIFVITGDHGSLIEPYLRPISNRHVLLELSQRVPLIIYSPLLQGGITVAAPASHIDVMPTLLQLIHAPVRTGLGVDLFNPAERESRVLPMWNAHQRTLTLVTKKWIYHAQYGGTAPVEESAPAETLIDAVRDPGGQHNVALVQPAVTAHFRQLAHIYVSIYPWLVVHGRTGIPPEMRRRNFAPAVAASTSSAHVAMSAPPPP